MAWDHAVVDPGESGMHASGSATWTGWVTFLVRGAQLEGCIQAGMRHGQGEFVSGWRGNYLTLSMPHWTHMVPCHTDGIGMTWHHVRPCSH